MPRWAGVGFRAGLIRRERWVRYHPFKETFEVKPEVTPGLSPHQDSSPRGSLFKLRVAAPPMCSRLWGWLALVACESRLLAAGLRPIGHGQSAAHRRISGESERLLSPSLPLSGTAAGPRDRPGRGG